MKVRQDAISDGMIQLLPLIFNMLSKDQEKTASPFTHLQSHILETLFQIEQGMAISELAKVMNISKQQMTPILQKLEDSGYIERIRDLNDKRSFIICLSENGKLAISQKWEQLYHHFCHKLERLNDEEQVDLEYAIYKLNNILKKLI